MAWLENRILNAEQRLEKLYRMILDLLQKLAALQARTVGTGGGDGGSGGSAAYYACTLSGNLAHGSSIAAQTVWTFKNGARSTLPDTATVYNDGPNGADDINSGNTVILASNGDGTFTAIGVYC